MSAVATLIGTLLAFAGSCWLLKDLFVKSPLDNVPGPPSPSFLKGHMEKLFHRIEGWKLHAELTTKYAPVSRISGFLGKRVLYVFDPAALQSIVLKDQQFYEESSFTISMNLLLFGPGVGSTLREQHRKQRKMLVPAFSIKHLREMTPIFFQVAGKLRDGIQKQIEGSSEEVDMLSWMGRTALEIVGQAGLGYSFDPLVEESKNSFGEAIKATFPTVCALGGMVVLGPYVIKLGPPSLRRWLVNLLPSRKVQSLKAIVDILDMRSREIIAEKRSAIQQGDGAIQQQVGEGNDIMSVLLRANMKAAGADQLSEDELVAQMASLLFAATDTTSGALAQILQLLAQHPDAQDKLRTEILQASDQELSFDQLVDLPYLDAVCRETMRVCPPVIDVHRESRKDMVLPLSEPIRGVDGTWMKEIPVPEDTRIVVNLLGCNKNKAIWGEDADVWKPERWLSPLPDSVTDARIPGVYSNLMSFLGGGKSCIGFKFSQLEMKVVLVVLLRKFKFSPSEKSIVWNLSFVKYPTVEGSTKASMPMKVEIFQKGL